MILAEKIVKLRKEQGWSQEDLAMRLGVSRQSVSKWESMASLPDLDKIVNMSELFGVSTDYLLKDEAPPEAGCTNEPDAEPPVRTVTLEEANRYLTVVRETASWLANGVSLCILSPVALILLAAAEEAKRISWSEAAAVSVGVCTLVVIVAAAVALMVFAGMRLNPYEYLEKEPIRTEYGVAGIAESKRAAFEPAYKKRLVSGILLCILSVLPLLATLATEDGYMISCAVAAIFPLVAAGVNLMIRAVSVWESYQKLLEEGDYTREHKALERKNEPFVAFYWSLVLAIYLAASFISSRWDVTWIIWPVMAVLFGGVLALQNMLRRKP